MKRFVEGEDRRQGVLLPEYLDDYVSEENPVRVIEVFVEELDLGALGFEGVIPEATGRPAYHPGLDPNRTLGLPLLCATSGLLQLQHQGLLLYYLVGAGEQCGRHHHTQRLGGF
jgi:hypothetical protein